MSRQLRRTLQKVLLAGFFLLYIGKVCAASHAVLIGIGDYTGTGLESLEGPRNDIFIMRTLLRNRFALPEENIVVLKDKEATHTKVGAAFLALAQRVKPDDFVYIHYSGHGSYTANKTEKNKQNQTWVTYGARSKKSQGLDDHDVLDKEISQWLAPLYAKTKNVIFVSDSCHSATVSRGGILKGVRGVSPDPRSHPLILQSPENPASIPGIRIGAARDTETAVEIDVDRRGACGDRGKCQGIFTWYWAQALQEAKPGERWDDVFRRTYARVTTQHGISQRPQLEGNAEIMLFGGHFATSKPTLSVIMADPKLNTVTLDAGSVNGVTKDSIYKLHSSLTTNWSDVPSIKINSVQAFTSEGRIQSGKLKPGDLVIEQIHAYQLEPLRLYVWGDFVNDLDRPLWIKVKNSLRTLPGFKLTEDKLEADWIIYIVRPRKYDNSYVDPFKIGTLPKSSRNQSPEIWVFSPQGRLLHERMRIELKDLEKGVSILKRNLEKFARASEMKRLESRGNPSSVNLEISAWRHQASCRKECIHLSNKEQKEKPYSKIGVYKLDDKIPMLKQGDVLTFSIKNISQDRIAWYTYILLISSDSTIQSLFPSRYNSREEALLNYEETRNLAKDFALELDVRGVEVIKIITTRASIDARLFENPGYVRDKTNLLEKTLTEAMSTRAKPRYFHRSEWATEQVEVHVGE